MAIRALSIEDGNLVSSSTIVGARASQYKDIDLSFENRTSGDIYKKIDAGAVRQSVKNILLTNRLEKPFNPYFGAGLNALLFELMDDDLEEQIIIHVNAAIKNYEPRAIVKEVTASALPDNNSVRIYVRFQVVSTDELVELTTNLTRLR
jgi:phage baseplate assembly protein W